MRFKRIILYIFSLVIFSGMLAGCTSAPITYTAKGYVLENGLGVEGVKVSTIFGDVFTDENGFYSIKNLPSATQISVYKDDCVFEISNKVFYPNVEQDVNFEAFSYYDISGTVTEGGIAVAGVTVNATGKKGGKTVTDSNGHFVIQNVAGTVNVDVEDTQNKYLSYVATKTNNSLAIDCVCTLNGKVLENGLGIENVLVVSGSNSTYTNSNGEFTLNKDSQSNELKFFNEDYHFDTHSVLVENTEQNIVLEVFKKYSASGTVVCGNQVLSGVKVYSKTNPSNFVVTGLDGKFNLLNLYSADTLIAEKQGFACQQLNTNNQISNANIYATFTLKGMVNSDDNQQNDFVVTVGQNSIPTSNGIFALSGVKFGDVATVSKDGYICLQTVTINSTDNILFNVNKLYSVTGVVTVDDVLTANIVVKVGDKQTITNENGEYAITDLYGEHNVTFDTEKYFVIKDNNKQTSFNNFNINANLQEYYTASLTFNALNTPKVSEQITVNNQTYTTDENGNLSFEKLYGEQILNCQVQNYNNQTVTLTKLDAQKIVNFTYTVTGYVTSDDVFIEGVKISYGTDFVTTDENGYYIIENLTEQVELVASKEFYTFTGGEVANRNQTINFDATYKIIGKLVMDGVDATTVTMYLYSYKTDTTIQTSPNANGEYSFDNLYGKYYLYFNKDITTNNLKPTGYNVSIANNNYDFSSQGYSVSGKIVCGDLPLVNVKLNAGTSNTKTDEQGNFTFDVLFGETVITPQLKGYTFTPASITVDETMDGTTDLSFTATYDISGTITCGIQKLSGVTVKIKDTDIITTADENGVYIFTNLSGVNELEITKDGYTFAGQTVVTTSAEHNFTATFTVSGYAQCGDSFVSGVTISTLSKSVTTNSQGYFELSNLVYGTELTISKTGYNFGNGLTVNEPTDELLFTATYSVTGKVSSGDIPLAGATVTCGEITITTDGSGYFEILGLTNSNLVTVTKQNYDTSSYTFTGPENNYTFNLSYTVSGVVKSINSGLAGVKITSQSKTTTTNDNGEYTLSGLYGASNLILEKQGYTFIGQTAYNSPTTLNFDSTFNLIGRVLTGTIPVANLTVYYLQSSVTTNENGYFEIYDLNQIVELSLIKDGYNPIFTEEISGYTANLNYNLTYIVSGKVTGQVDNSGVKVTAVCGDTTFETTTNAEGKYSFNELFGSATISFSKEQVRFVPASFATEVPTTKNATAYSIYTVTGRVTAGSLSVQNMPIYVGKDIVTYTDVNGYYTLNGLYDKSSIIGKFSAQNCTTIQTEQFDTTGAATKDFKIDQNNYLFWLWQKGYQNLRESSSYSSTLTGQVDAGAGGIQTVGGFRKKGTNGVYLKEDTNYGASKFGVDPKVAVMTYYDPKNPNNVSYIQHKNVSEGPNPNYAGTSWTNTTVEAYTGHFGISPTDFTQYIINRSTINSFSDISYANGVTTFTLNLDPKNSTTNYAIRMNAYSGQTPSGFNHVKLTYKVDSNGNLLSMSIDESYNVTVVITVTCTAQLTETFKINDSSVGAITKPTF